ILERHTLIEGVVDLHDPGGSYVFGHSVVHRTVYGDVSLPRRRLMHAKVADVLELGAASLPEEAHALAHHAMLAGANERAARACLRAGRHCLAMSASADAHALGLRGLRCAQALSECERQSLEAELQDLVARARSEPAQK